MKDLKILKLLPKFKHNIHKGQMGKLLIVAGSLPMLGAAILSVKAALRSGVGQVFLMTVKEACPFFQINLPEVIVYPVSSKDGFLAFDQAEIQYFFENNRVDACLLGPGLGRLLHVSDSIHHVLDFCSSLQIPLLLDADAFYSLCYSDIKMRKNTLVLTPHVGEFKSFFSLDLDLQYDHNLRYKLCCGKAADLDQVLVLKGAKTIIADAQQSYVNSYEHFSLAKAGAGDVLAGMIAAFLSQKMAPFSAAKLGVHLHSLAAQRAFQLYGRSLVSSDIIEAFASLMPTIENL